MKEKINSFKLIIPAKSCNEAYCRSTATAFLALADPTVEDIADVKTIISEAVTNCIVHAYKHEKDNSKKIIYITGSMYSDNTFKYTIKDKGCGIEDIDKAMQPLYTTDPENERSGMGLPIMQSFSDSFRVRSSEGKGTVITFTKKINSRNEQYSQQ